MGLEFLGLGLAIAVGSIGEAVVIKQALESTARQPEMQGTLRTLMIIGVAMVETCVIFSFILGLLLWIKM